MSYLLPWNNPIVATALQVRFRRGGLFTTTVLYVFVLAAAGMAWDYYCQTYPGSAPQNPLLAYFVALISFQCMLNTITAGSRVTNAMKTEVLNKTLDFQRIAALSPLEILLGKVFGEPVMAYLLTFASIPIAVGCMVLQVRGVSPLVLLLLYVQIFTLTLMIASTSLQHRLVIPAGKTAAPAVGFGAVVGLTVWGAFQFAVTGGPNWVDRPWSVALAGLISPIPVLWSLVQHGDPWRPCLPLFGANVPFLVVTPLFHLYVTYLCLHIMSRRLLNPTNLAFDKASAYVLLLFYDILVLNVLEAAKPFAPGYWLGGRLVTFTVLHFIGCCVILGNITPTREMLDSWLWRFKEKRSWWFDGWLGDRSPNTMGVITCVLIGLAGMGYLYANSLGGTDLTTTEKTNIGAKLEAITKTADEILPWLIAVYVAAQLAYGVFFQWFALIGGKYGPSLFLLFAFMVVAVPAIGGAALAQRDAEELQRPFTNFLLDLSPAVHLISMAGAPFPLPNPWLLLSLYGAATIAVYVDFRRRIQRMADVITKKKRFMGVIPTTP
jgi:hypothetical protein